MSFKFSQIKVLILCKLLRKLRIQNLPTEYLEMIPFNGLMRITYNKKKIKDIFAFLTIIQLFSVDHFLMLSLKTKLT